jgi:hypothetical protein
VSVLALPLFFIARDAPPTPPSVIASKKEEPFEFNKELMGLLKNKNFLRVVSSMTLTFSAYISFITNQDLLFRPFGFTSTDNSIFNVILVLSGLAGSVVSAKLLDQGNPQYKNLFNVLNIIGAILMALFLVTLPSGVNQALFGTNLFLYGLFMIPTFSIIFPYVAELTYPSHEAVSNALMLFMCRLFATCFGVFGTLLADTGDDPKST